MRFIVAPDSFKGSLGAVQAAGAMERGIRAVFPAAEVRKVPVADGGEGTVAALVASADGRLVDCPVRGPLGRPVKALFGLLGDGTGVVEAAAACGLPLVPSAERNPERTTSYGVGELVRAALDHGCRKVIIGLGGSSTNDGGMGMAAALGVRFTDRGGNNVEPLIANLDRVVALDLAGLDPRLSGVEVLGACDVSSPLCGPGGASLVFAPQKGATPESAARLDRLLGRLAVLIREAAGRDVAALPGAGAAGGLGAGVSGFLGGRLVSGSELVLKTSRLAEHLAAGADLVLTGEGEINAQTVLGKAPGAVGRLAAEYGIPVVAVVGAKGPGYREVYGRGIGAVYCIVPRPMSLAEALSDACGILEEGVAELLRVWRLGRSGR
ncbi:MAG: glycerate kinase [Peptococcaceae bacterium]|jgi:glycerate kinase|nr:glycerate kinase [Peptococcaceae bacterium]